MDQERAGAEPLLRQRAGLVLAALAPREQVAIGMHHVRVAGDRAEPLAPAAGGLDFAGDRADRVDPHHRIVQADGAAQPLEQPDHRRDQAVGAAARPPDPAAPLQRVDQRVNRAGGHRIAADQQGMEAERLAQLFRADVARNHRIDRAPRLLADKRRARAGHRAEIEQRHVAELHVAVAIGALGKVEEILVTGDVLGRDAGDLVAQGSLVGRVIERRAVGPGEAVERRDRQELDVVAHVPAGQRPELVQRGRIGDRGRARVEREPVALPEIGAPPRLVAGFDQCRCDARALQPDRQREPAEPGADHAGALAGKGRDVVHKCRCSGWGRARNACAWNGGAATSRR